MALSLASNIVLARLLTPEQIGIYSVSLAVIGIAQVLRDFGIGNFLIQEKDLSEGHIRTAFGISLLLGGILFALVFLAAPWAGSFYGQDQIVETMRISSLNFVVLPFCTISLALLRREMKFARLIVVNLTAASTAVVISIVLAYHGYGPNSIAAGAVAGNIATGIGAWLARAGRPLLLPGLDQWRALVRFGGQSSLTGVVTSISMDANDLVVGKVLGFFSVAILSRAQGLMNIFHRDLMTAIRGVALPAFAAAHRRSEDLDAQHGRSVALVTVFAWPFYGVMALYPFEAMRLLFGPQWDAAVSLVPIFCLAGALAAVISLTPSLLIALGRIDLVTRAELLLQPLRFCFIAIAAVVFRSVEACALAFLAASVVGLPVFMSYKVRAMPKRPPLPIGQMLRSIGVTFISLLPAFVHVGLTGFRRTTPIDPMPMVASLLLVLLAWLVAVRLLKHPICTEPLYLRLFGPLGVPKATLTKRDARK